MSKEYRITMNGLTDELVASGDQVHLQLLAYLGRKAQAEFDGDEFRREPNDSFYFIYDPRHEVDSCQTCIRVNQVLKAAMQTEETALREYLGIG